MTPDLEQQLRATLMGQAPTDVPMRLVARVHAIPRAAGGGSQAPRRVPGTPSRSAFAAASMAAAVVIALAATLAFLLRPDQQGVPDHGVGVLPTGSAEPSREPRPSTRPTPTTPSSCMGVGCLGRPIAHVPGWTSEPTPVDPAFAKLAARHCRSGGAQPLADMASVADQRGPSGAVFWWLGDDETRLCVVGVEEDGDPWVPWGGAGHVTPETRASAGNLVLLEYEISEPTVVGGLVPAGASRVEVDTPTRRGIGASVHDGLFLAWWPGPELAIAIRALDSHGDVIEEIGVSPASSASPLPSLPVAWEVADHPESRHQRTVDALWSDDRVALANVATPTGPRIWASTDQGASWQRAALVDQDGEPFEPQPEGGFSFTRTSDGTYYALTVPEEPQAKSTTNTAILRSADGLRWELVARHKRLPEGVDLRAFAPQGLVASGAITTPDDQGVRYERDGGRTVQVRPTPVILTSADGVTWAVSATLPLGPDDQGDPGGMVVAPDGSIVLDVALWTSPEQGSYQRSLWRSVDGMAFERLSLPHDDESFGGFGAYDEGIYLMDARSNGPLDTEAWTTVWTSSDGGAWDAHAMPVPGVFREGAGLGDDILLLDPDPREDGLVGRLLTEDGRWLDVAGPAGWVASDATAAGPHSVAMALRPRYVGNTATFADTPILVVGDVLDP